MLKVLKSCSNCKVFEDIKDESSPTVPNDVARKDEIIPSEKLDQLKPNPVDNQNVVKEKKVIQVNPSNIEVPKIKVTSENGRSDTISPINVALGITAAGIKATEQIKQKKRVSLGVKASEQTELKQEAIDKQEKLQNTKSSNETTSHQISKPVDSAELTIPVSLQTKSELTSNDDSTHSKTSKTLQSPKTHLSSTKAINEFIGDVLYRFNYTAGFHGHEEEGDHSGNKRGSYFIIGRDNVRRGVIYVANENGFVPVVKYEKVSSAEAPHEDTEKNAGLRGYEFEWFHKSKSR